MPKFQIPVTWTMRGYHEVDDLSLQKAVMQVNRNNYPLPTTKQKFVGSKVDMETLREQNRHFAVRQEKCPNCSRVGKKIVGWAHDALDASRFPQDGVLEVHCPNCGWEWAEPDDDSNPS